ncbi:MAG TPA: EF-hand domain-containing protein [Pirellulales bacterium]|nr:EF-hand domain-containing protein [Pirellulales bacterium]
MKKLVAMFLGVALMFNVSSAFAAKKSKTPVEDRFKKLDSNGDGKLSLEEFQAGKKDADKAAAQFKKLDKNNDGFLDLEEFKAGDDMKKKKDA